jgi:hypothetical protein
MFVERKGSSGAVLKLVIGFYELCLRVRFMHTLLLGLVTLRFT